MQTNQQRCALHANKWFRSVHAKGIASAVWMDSRVQILLPPESKGRESSPHELRYEVDTYATGHLPRSVQVCTWEINSSRAGASLGGRVAGASAALLRLSRLHTRASMSLRP